MGDTPSGVVARRMWPLRVDRLRVVDPRPGKPHLYRAMTVFITSVQGCAREPHSGFPDGAGWVELFEGGLGRGWRVPSVVDVPAIFSDKLQSKLYENVEVPQIQFIVTVLDIPVATQRRSPTVQSVQKTGEIPQVQFLDMVDDARCCSTTGA